jgi:hypothetical protein
VDLLFGEALAQEISKFLPASKLQKAGERLLIELLIEAKTDLPGIKDHDVGRKKVTEVRRHSDEMRFL